MALQLANLLLLPIGDGLPLAAGVAPVAHPLFAVAVWIA